MANEYNITYSINSDELIREVDNTMKRITEINRTNAADQIRVMTEVYSQLTLQLDSYMDRVRANFSTYIDIAKNTWQLASSDAQNYYDEVIKKMDDLTRKEKDSTDEQLRIKKDATKESLNNITTETESRLDSIKKQNDAEKELAEQRKKLREVQSNITGGISGVIDAGGLGNTTSSILQMGGNLVGGGLNILSGLNAGQGVKDIMGVVTQGIGMLIKSVKETDDLKRGILKSYGGEGIDIDSIYGGELEYKGNAMMNRLKTTQAKYADTPELNANSQLQLNQQYQGSRTMGDNTDYHQLGVETAMIGIARNMNGSEVAQLFIELRQKLNEPLENLTGRFFQLDNISKDLGISLRDVIKDYQQLMRDNQKYGYTQEQVMGIYQQFGDEIKKGTISVGQLSDYMKGISGMGTDQSVGVASMLKQDQEGIMSKFTGNKGNAEKIFNLLNGASDTDAGVILKMINNPTANYESDPFLSEIMKKYNLTTDILQKLNPDVEKLIQAKAINQAGSENLGTARIIEEKMYQLLGLGLPDNFVDSMFKQEGINSVGTSKGIMSLGDATRKGGSVLNNQADNLSDLAPWTSQIEETLKQSIERTSAIAEQTYKESHDLSKTGSAIFNSLKTEGDKLFSMFGQEQWMNQTDKFSSSVDKFANTIGMFSEIVDTVNSIRKLSSPMSIYDGIKSIVNELSSDDKAYGNEVFSKLTRASTHR